MQYILNPHNRTHARKTTINNYIMRNIVELSKQKYEKPDIDYCIGKQLVSNGYPTYNTPIIPIEQYSESKFWMEINKLRWRDLDDDKINDDHLSVHQSEAKYIKKYINKKMDVLRIALNDILYLIESQNHNDFLAHIVSKGEDFYKNVIEDPTLSMYLINNINPLWTMLQNFT